MSAQGIWPDGSSGAKEIVVCLESVPVLPASLSEELAEALEQVGRFLCEGDLDMQDIEDPRDWASYSCDNRGHSERHNDDWRCLDCGSTWWSIADEGAPFVNHLNAFIFRALARYREAVAEGGGGE